jgi:hypothetical protein
MTFRKRVNLPLHNAGDFCHAQINHRPKMPDDHFHPEKLLAGGPAAKVYCGVETATGRKVLLKALLHEDETPNALDRERLQLLAPMLMQMRHPQIAGLITMVPTEDEFALIYDFMPGMNVRAFANERQTSPADLRALAVQLMHALLAGEQLRQPHGDPKPSNLIIADHPGGGLFMQVQDWGLSLARSIHPTETLWFRAPELHASNTPTSQSDLFTAAASLFCLATNSAPAQGEDAADLIQQWQAFDAGPVLAHLRPDLDPPLRDWLTWLLRPDPRQRPHSMAQALEMLMPTLHSGFIYMPQQAPQMAAGTQTTPLTSVAHPNAPKPKPIVPKATAEAAKAVAPPQASAPAKKSSAARLFIAVALNGIAIALLGVLAWPVLREWDWQSWLKRGDVTAATAASSLPASTTFAAPSKPEAAGVKGRYIRIELPGKAALNLAVVQVFSEGANIALKGEASQSSTSAGGAAALAIDGNTDGDMPKTASVSHTDGRKTNPWWKLDLGQDMPIESIVIWNRTDGDFGERTQNLTVKILTTHQRVIWEKKGIAKPDPQVKISVQE